jgi:hypothetical protein
MFSANGTCGLIHNCEHRDIIDPICDGNFIENYDMSFYMDPFERIKQSLEYGALDHKWIARDYLKEHVGEEVTHSTKTLTETEQTLYSMATSAFDYYTDHYDVLQSDPSLKAITEMCATDDHRINVGKHDEIVYHLSNIFNEIIESDRGLHKCYDCGTNARAIFLKLIETHRGLSYITHLEQQRMKDEYLVRKRQVGKDIDKCHRIMKEAQSDTVFIMSLAIQSFGHVWVIEKRFIPGPGPCPKLEPRYHHYQTSLRSHLLLDFIEHKDYGRNLHLSLDITRFFTDLVYILTKQDAWNDKDYRLFAEMFAFSPVREISEPSPGFSCTWITY